MPLNPSHVPRLVYDFLSQTGCQKAADQYADECPYLTGLKYFAETSGNKTLPSMGGPTLRDIVEKFYSVNEDVGKSTEQTKCVKCSAVLGTEGNKSLIGTAAFVSQNVPKEASTPLSDTQGHQNHLILVDHSLPTENSTQGHIDSDGQLRNKIPCTPGNTQSNYRWRPILPRNQQVTVPLNHQTESTPSDKNDSTATTKNSDDEKVVSSHLSPISTVNVTTNAEQVKTTPGTPVYVGGIAGKNQQPQLLGYITQPMTVLTTPEGPSSAERSSRPVRPIAPKPSPQTVEPKRVVPSTTNVVMEKFVKKLDSIIPIPASQILAISEALAQNPEMPLGQISAAMEKNLSLPTASLKITMTSTEASMKCLIFMSVLLHLSKQPGCAAAGVRMLVESLLNGIIDTIEFVKDLQRILKSSSSSPGLIPFLTASVPHLKQFLIRNKATVEGIKMSQQPGTRPSTIQSTAPAPMISLASNIGRNLVADTTVTAATKSSLFSVRPILPKSAELVPGTCPSTLPSPVPSGQLQTTATTVHATSTTSSVPPFQSAKNGTPEVPKAKREVPALIALPNATIGSPTQLELGNPVKAQSQASKSPTSSENGMPGVQTSLPSSPSKSGLVMPPRTSNPALRLLRIIPGPASAQKGGMVMFQTAMRPAGNSKGPIGSKSVPTQMIATQAVPFTPITWIPVSCASETPASSIQSPTEGPPSSSKPEEVAIISDSEPMDGPVLTVKYAPEHVVTDLPSTASDSFHGDSPPPEKKRKLETRPCSVVLRRAFDLSLPQGTFSISM